MSLAAYITYQSRGQPIAPPDDPRLAPFREQGAEIYQRRQGQLNLSCAICHDDNAGKKLAGVDHSARRIPPAIRSIAWNGRRWAR